MAARVGQGLAPSCGPCCTKGTNLLLEFTVRSPRLGKIGVFNRVLLFSEDGALPDQRRIKLQYATEYKTVHRAKYSRAKCTTLKQTPVSPLILASLLAGHCRLISYY